MDKKRKLNKSVLKTSARVSQCPQFLTPFFLDNAFCVYCNPVEVHFLVLNPYLRDPLKYIVAK